LTSSEPQGVPVSTAIAILVLVTAAALAPELFVDIGLDEQARVAAAAQLGKGLTRLAPDVTAVSQAPRFPTESSRWFWPISSNS